jgi:hypothetical protein
MANFIDIIFRVDSKALGASKKQFAAVREQGEKLRGLGMAITAGITLPIVAGGIALNKFGADAKKTVDEAAKMMQEANLSGDPTKIKEAAEANRAISMTTRDAANSYAQLQQAMAPVNAEMQKFQAEALKVMVPLLKEAVPLLTSMAKGATDLVKGFAALPQPSKDALIAVGAFGMALGPVVTLVGQAKWMMGTLGQQFPLLAKGITSVVFPLVAWAVAIKTLIELFKMDEWRQGLAALRGQVTLAVTGDKVAAAQSALAGYKELGGGAAGSGDTGEMVRGILGGGTAQQQGGNGVTINYAPQSLISTGTPAETQQAVRTLQQLLPQTAQTGRR